MFSVDCSCLGDIPLALTDGSQYASLPNISSYGSSCESWDDNDGTPWKGSCPDGYDVCGDKNWCSLPWCYVNPGTCKESTPTDVFADDTSSASSMAFSYGVCGTPDCYHSESSTLLSFTGQCPYDPEDTCGETTPLLHPWLLLV